MGCIDAVGGAALPSVLAALRYGGAVASCGNAGGNDFATSVLPFILRGARLLGIDSVMCPRPRRQEAWRRLARDMPMEALDSLASTVGLEELSALADRILAGQTEGRIVVALDR
jgi:acrylyl-CoA reductase (NADPH)